MDAGGAGGNRPPPPPDSVNLSSGVYENNPGPDLIVRNPNGPDAMYERSYHTGRAAAGYFSPGLAVGWTDNYDLTLTYDASNHLSLNYPNGAADALTASGLNTFAAPAGAPYLATGVPDMVNIGYWTKFTLMYSDLSKMVFTPRPAEQLQSQSLPADGDGQPAWSEDYDRSRPENQRGDGGERCQWERGC